MVDINKGVPIKYIDIIKYIVVKNAINCGNLTSGFFNQNKIVSRICIRVLSYLHSDRWASQRNSDILVYVIC